MYHDLLSMNIYQKNAKRSKPAFASGQFGLSIAFKGGYFLHKVAEGDQSKGLRILARTFYVRAAQQGENACLAEQTDDMGAIFTERKSRLIGFHRLSAPPRT